MCEACMDPTQVAVQAVDVSGQAIPGWFPLAPSWGGRGALLGALGLVEAWWVMWLTLVVLEGWMGFGPRHLPGMQATQLRAAVRCYFPADSTTMAAALTTRGVEFGGVCPLAAAFHHRSLPDPRDGLVLATDITSLPSLTGCLFCFACSVVCLSLNVPRGVRW